MTEDHDAVLVTKAAYEADARAWADRRRGAFVEARYQRIRDLLPGGALVLDLGCGPGNDAALLAELGLAVVGLDLTRSMLEVARARARTSSLLEGDSRRLPLASAAFDGVWASASLLHLPKTQVDLALAEARRVLKPGGVICTFMKMGDHDGIMTAEQRGGTASVRGDRYFAHYGPSEWPAHLRASGFSLIEQHTFDVQAQLPNTPWLTTYALAAAPAVGPGRLEATVRGRVQGVGFRFFVERQANALGLAGSVRNLPDGSTVEVLAEGEPEELYALLADLHRGPRHAAVESVEVSWGAARGGLPGFGIAG
jgi:acylphosphatase/ubiquinone/menaquinone biosynthesis C-methylase UbiE